MGVDVMRRVGVIVTLTALLGMFGGAVTASPGPRRGRGDWCQFFPLGSGTATGF